MSDDEDGARVEPEQEELEKALAKKANDMLMAQVRRQFELYDNNCRWTREMAKQGALTQLESALADSALEQGIGIGSLKHLIPGATRKLERMLDQVRWKLLTSCPR